ncbi:MAG: hypothetical protein Q8N88_01260 [Nanoarchaeota archaeon]|nr:hypothetical protein [Nanoarchaeota archaeon]
MKKIAGVSAFLLGISLVSAGPVEGTRQLLDGAREIFLVILQFLFNLSYDLEIYNQFLFAKIILMILIFIIVYTVCKKTIFKDYVDDKKKGKPVLYIISAAIAILSIRYLPDEYIQAILLPYSSLGVGLSVFLPLFIFFYFLQDSANVGSFGRRAGWVIFGASFIALWSARYDELSEANWIYWIGVAFIIFSFIFDKKLHEYFALKEIREHRKEYHNRMWADYQESIQKIDVQLRDVNLPEKVRRSLERTRDKLYRQQKHHIDLS